FSFGTLTFRRYLLNNFIIYTILLVSVDGLTMGLFNLFLDERISLTLILSLISYRVMVTLGAFLVSLAFNTIYLFYVTSFSLFLVITLLSGAVIPLDGLTKRWSWITEINPLHAFLSGTFFNWWL